MKLETWILEPETLFPRLLRGREAQANPERRRGLFEPCGKLRASSAAAGCAEPRRESEREC